MLGGSAPSLPSRPEQCQECTWGSAGQGGRGSGEWGKITFFPLKKRCPHAKALWKEAVLLGQAAGARAAAGFLCPFPPGDATGMDPGALGMVLGPPQCGTEPCGVSLPPQADPTADPGAVFPPRHRPCVAVVSEAEATRGQQQEDPFPSPPFHLDLAPPEIGIKGK